MSRPASSSRSTRPDGRRGTTRARARRTQVDWAAVPGPWLVRGASERQPTRCYETQGGSRFFCTVLAHVGVARPTHGQRHISGHGFCALVDRLVEDDAEVARARRAAGRAREAREHDARLGEHVGRAVAEELAQDGEGGL